MIKVTGLKYFISITFTLKFGVKGLLSEGGGTGRGYTWAPGHLLKLARLISKKTSRYCHSPGVVVVGGKL